MSRYCMQNTQFAESEKLMMMQPNYKPHGGGRKTRYRYTAADCDCVYCAMTDEKESCRGVKECICFEERLAAGCWSYYELLDRFIEEVGDSKLKNRMQRVLTEQQDVFKNKTHHKRMNELTAADIERNRSYLAAVFLLSADRILWQKVRHAVYQGSIDFSEIDVSGIGTDGYTLYKAAKHIYLDKKHLTTDELCDSHIIGINLFRLIIGAFIIRRYGLPAKF